MFGMRRREFVTLLGGAAAMWPLAARAQQPAMPVVGHYARRGSRCRRPLRWPRSAKGLREAGYVEDQNVTIEYRWSEAAMIGYRR